MKTRTAIVALMVVIASPSSPSQWKQTPSPAFSSLWALTIKDTAFLYASGARIEGGNGVLFRSGDNGNHWDTLASLDRTKPLPHGSGQIWSNMTSVDTALVASVSGYENDSEWYYVVRSLDGGHTWRDTTRTARVVGLLKMGSRLYTFEDGIVIRSSVNCGVTWDTVKQSDLPSDQLGAVVCKGSMIFCGTLNHGVFRSTSFGESWVSAGVPPDSGTVMTLNIVGDTVFSQILGIVDGRRKLLIFRSTNDGVSWSFVSMGLSGAYGTDHLWSDGHLLFCDTGSDILVSANRGDSWDSWAEGLPASPRNPVSFMTFSKGFVFVAVAGGVWRRPLLELTTSAAHRSHEVPKIFGLSQNYPNPFNPVTTFQFSIVNRQLTILKVYDILGREVATLVNEVKQPGVYTVQWDASRQSSGVYFYRLQSGSFVDVKKLILLR